MQRWEHIELRYVIEFSGKILTHINSKQVHKEKIEFYSYLDECGNEGWEVVSSYLEPFKYGHYVLKRPIE